MKEFKDEVARLVSTYGLSDVYAGCYLSNFGDEFICKKFVGGCNRVNVCKKLHQQEMNKQNCSCFKR